MSKPKKTELPKCFTKDCLIDDACCAINGRDINKLYYRRKVIDEYEAWIKGKIQIKDDTIDDIVLVLSHYVRDMRGSFHSEEYINKVKALRNKLIEMGNNKLLGGGK